MSRSGADPDAGSSQARIRVLVLTAALALAGVLGAAEALSPYDIRVDEGEGDGGVPPGSLALVEEAPPQAGDLAAYHAPGLDLAADRVEAVRDTGPDRYYVLASGVGGDGPPIVGDEQVMGQLVGHVPHVGTPWTLPLTVHAVVNAALVGAYIGVGTLGGRGFRPGDLFGFLGGPRGR